MVVLAGTLALSYSLLQVAQGAATSPVSASLGGKTYTNKGLVGFGLIPNDAKDSTGETLGSLGSAIAIKHGTWKALNSTTYSGTFLAGPDRGYNVNSTVDYQARQHEIDFIFTPYYGTSKLGFTDAQKTLQSIYKNTVIRTERNNTATSGLDPKDIRAAQSGYLATFDADPQMPIASSNEPHLTIDAEGLADNGDGTYWVSDEYGPYIYRFASDGSLIQTIQPPNAFLPLDKDGNLNFTAETDPHTGRSANQGFEGLTLDPINKKLYAMLQSATVQDGGGDNSRNTRLLAYDVSNLSVHPPLVGEWVVALPVSSQGKTQKCSEIHFVSPGVFLALSRDGNGRGGTNYHSKYKQADLFSIDSATDIHGTKYDDPSNPIASGGEVVNGITPATYVSFVDYVESNGLARFGLHNDDPNDQTLIDAKWESLALVPALDSTNPDDFFLFTASDNDFLTEDGVMVGEPYNAGQAVDNQFLVFRVTLPGAAAARGL